MKKIKVALIAAEFLPNWGGAGTYNIRLVKQLMNDFEIHVITPKRTIKNSKLIYSEEAVEKHFNNKIKVHFICDADDTFLYNAKFQWAVSRRFKELQRHYKFDLIHTDHPHMSDVLYKPEVPEVLTVHTTIGWHLKGIRQSHISFVQMEPSERYQVILNIPLLAVEQFYLKKRNHIITVSNSMKKELQRKYHFQDIDVIYSGVEEDIFIPWTGKDFNILPQIKVPIVLMSSRMTAAKGAYYLIKAIPQILRENNQVHFVFAGSGLNQPWQSLLEKEGIGSKYYSFLGYLPYEQLPELYARSSIFVCPSLCENLPARVLEAMSCQVPAVATNIYGIPDAITDNQNGILVPPQDEKSLAVGIIQLLNNDSLRRKMGENARKTVMEKFTWNKIAQDTKAVYYKVVE